VTRAEREELLADEWLIVRHSGEIPEIALHSSIYFLTQSSDGPQLILDDKERVTLTSAAAQRYQEIVLRDIQLGNFHKSTYRGVRRTVYNWERWKAFAHRQSVDHTVFQSEAAEALLDFLEQGVAVSGKTLPNTFINCNMAQLVALATDFGLTMSQLPMDVSNFCLSES